MVQSFVEEGIITGPDGQQYVLRIEGEVEVIPGPVKQAIMTVIDDWDVASAILYAIDTAGFVVVPKEIGA